MLSTRTEPATLRTTPLKFTFSHYQGSQVALGPAPGNVRRYLLCTALVCFDHASVVHRCVPNRLVFMNKMLQTYCLHFNDTFHVPARLWMVFSSCDELCTICCTQCSENFWGRPRTVVGHLNNENTVTVLSGSSKPFLQHEVQLFFVWGQLVGVYYVGQLSWGWTESLVLSSWAVPGCWLQQSSEAHYVETSATIISAFVTVKGFYQAYILTQTYVRPRPCWANS